MTVWTRSPDFWWSPPSIYSRMLMPAEAIYASIASRRMQRAPQFTARIPVICVGNFVAGGAGKTPVALALGKILADAGKRPGFLSRGYGGSLSGPAVVDPQSHSAAEVGDEPLLLAKRAITVVARDRVAGARLIEKAAIDCIILDDGFQNPGLKKTQSWVVVDGVAGVGNGRCIPAGPLRAPLDLQLRHADTIVAMGEGRGRDVMTEICHRAGIDVIAASLDLSFDDGLRNDDLLAWCGIGRPGKFFDSLDRAGLRVTRRIAFADHHRLSETEARDLLRAARIHDSVPVTTEKDFVRMKRADGAAQNELAAMSRVIYAKCRFEDADLAGRKLHAAFS